MCRMYLRLEMNEQEMKDKGLVEQVMNYSERDEMSEQKDEKGE